MPPLTKIKHFIYSSIKVLFGYRTCFCGIWNTVILVFDVFMRYLFCVSQVTMRESSVLMLCVIAIMSVLSVSRKVTKYCEVSYHQHEKLELIRNIWEVVYVK